MTCVDTVLELDGIAKSLGGREILLPLSVRIRRHELVCVLGPSGCGKSTLLRIIAGLECPDSGKILMNGQDITSALPEQRRIGMMFQNYALFPNLTTRENIAYGLHHHSRKERNQRVEEMLQLTGLHDCDHLLPTQLSGGQQQRVALARALAPSPDLLLLDEPLSALDAAVRTTLGEELRRTFRKLHLTGIMVTHDQREALALADSVIVMRNGRLEQVGTPYDIYRRPNSRFVAEFVGSMNCLAEHFGGGGVRPEDVCVALPTEALLKRDDTWLARVEECRPWGGRMRLVVVMGDRQTRLCVEVPADAQITPGDLVAVSVLKQHRYFWPTGSSDV